MTPQKRCAWVPADNALYETYHDTEWGVFVTDERKLFEFLLLESAQAGLSWETILKKREAYRKAFAEFDPEKIAHFTKRDIEQLLKNPGIVRHRLKVLSAVSNAKIFLDIQKEFGSFANYLSTLLGKKVIDGKRKTTRDIPAATKEAELLAKDLKRRGCKFFGSVIAYAFLQATGRVNDHTKDCFRYQEISREKK